MSNKNRYGSEGSDLNSEWENEDFVPHQSDEKLIEDPWIFRGSIKKHQRNSPIFEEKTSTEGAQTNPLLSENKITQDLSPDEQTAQQDFRKDLEVEELNQEQAIEDDENFQTPPSSVESIDYASVIGESDLEVEDSEHQEDFAHYYFEPPNLEKPDESDQQSWVESLEKLDASSGYREQLKAETKAEEIVELIQWHTESERKRILQFLIDFYLEFRHHRTHEEIQKVVELEPTFDILRAFIELRTKWSMTYSGERFKDLTWENAYTICKFQMESSIGEVAVEGFVNDWFDSIEVRKNYIYHLEEYFNCREPFSGSVFINDALCMQAECDYTSERKDYIDWHSWLGEYDLGAGYNTWRKFR